MLIQGDLQSIFDALYSMGVIDPVLQKDWDKLLKIQHGDYAHQAINAINNLSGDVNAIVTELKKYDSETLESIAVEVAREYAGYHTREKYVH